MTVLTTKLDENSDAFRANAAHNRALAEELRARVAEAALGGNEKSRERHVSRGKLLPRERVERLLDPGSPFLEIGQLAACDMYKHEVPGAGMIAGIGRVSGRETMIVVQRRDGEGRHLLSDDGEEASARAGDRAAEPAAVASIWSTAAARTCRTRPRSSPTATISAGSSTTRRRCRPRGWRRSPA